LELLHSDFIILLEAQVKDFVELFESLDPFLEMDLSTAFLSVLTFTPQGGLSWRADMHRRHRGQKGKNIFSRDLAIAIEIVQLEDEVNLLVELRTVKAQQSCKELLLR
jgi:hypothetical protein